MTWMIEKAEQLAFVAGCKLRKHKDFVIFQFDFPGDKHVSVSVTEKQVNSPDFINIVAMMKRQGMKELEGR